MSSPVHSDGSVLRRSSRKRRNSSISCSDSHTSNSAELPSNMSIQEKRKSGVYTQRVEKPITPRKSSKRVRFSDLGPCHHGLGDASTGLTPAILRTSFEESSPKSNSRTRRRSTPMVRSRRSLDSAFPLLTPQPGNIFQWTPLRQVLDSRTQRRIRRVGLSDEINQYEREKRDAVKFEKALEILRQERNVQDAEIARLKEELHMKETPSSGSSDKTSMFETDFTSDRSRASCSAPSTPISSSPTRHLNNMDDIDDTIMFNDSGFENDTLLASNSPEMRPRYDARPLLPSGLSLLMSTSSGVDASAQASMTDPKQEADIFNLSRDLEAAKREKRAIFHQWKTSMLPLHGKSTDELSRLSSPPPDFWDQIIPTLTDALTRASDAAQALESMEQEISGLGFSGDNTKDIIADIRCHFRSARLELERAVPGETANVSLENGSATLDALVKRLKLVVKSLETERHRHNGSISREKALRGQFDALLARYEAASKKLGDLENTISSSASDMLHTRMKMQDLEREGKEQALGIDRLNAALIKYREEIKGLEALVTSLEKENSACQDSYTSELSELKAKLTNEEKMRHASQADLSRYEGRIKELERMLQQNVIRVCDLTARIESLEKEREEVVAQLEQKIVDHLQFHETETGALNVRISELTTSLDSTNSEVEQLRRIKTGLEEQLDLEINAKDALLDRWQADQARSFAFMKESINAERRKTKVRTANRHLQSDDLQSDITNIGSEPITPVSMTRFVDVEVGRGKHRRRLDSGIGILSEDLLEDMENEPELPPCLPSDIDLPSSDAVF
ncbi:hypothetical protein ASPZODRAFT_1858152 [Penicilliopsis zonata CBS 506.65]|uniref:Uncharacterized protein n=1 Tax=Penicilliopsis zonata CBS 506.65 TaxID=1073090 RepID=A0A1L9SIM5_9EURO|nr:hypothetical protein ASPZODRAFT_1858152 [Penicilliopsis zonata CBS 506.65]OJJ46933.1 hypothetical protein ASPZODRAFT_1858152 [Penicilliopsis zonata CBS 506.65]